VGRIPGCLPAADTNELDAFTDDNDVNDEFGSSSSSSGNGGGVD
jgi:hypothetical protein